MSVNVSNDEVVEYLRVRGSYNQVYRDLVMRKLTESAARQQGLKVADEELQAAADDFRAQYHLHGAKETLSWLEMSGLSVEQFEKYIETNLLIEKWKDKLLESVDAKTCVSQQPTRDIIRDHAFMDWVKQQASKG